MAPAASFCAEVVPGFTHQGALPVGYTFYEYAYCKNVFAICK